MPDEMVIRLATLDDVPEAVRMAAARLAESPFGMLFPPSRPQLERTVSLTLERGVGWLVEHRGLAVGMLGAVAGIHPATGQLYAEEVAWYVEPGYRQYQLGPRLLERLLDWCRTKNVTMLKMSSPVGSDIGTYLERQGFTAVEVAYVLVMAPG